MAVMMNPRETWTDQRLDDFKETVNQRFDRVDAEIRELRRMMLQGFIAQTTITVSCFVGVVSLFAF
jgi:hypothetical protein